MNKIAPLIALLFLFPSLSFASSPATSCSVPNNLTIGSTGASVTCLQQTLIAGGYSLPSGATGYFGAQTQAAVIEWQTAAQISPATGYFGAISRAAFNLGGSSSSVTAVTSTVPGCSAGTSFSATTGQSCKPTIATTYPSGCLSYSGYSATTGRSCGCFSASGYDELTGASCSPTLVAPPTPLAQTPPPNTTLCNGTYWNACPSGESLICPQSGSAYCQSNAPVQTGYQVCSTAFPNETWDGTYTSAGKYSCVCKTGYGWDSTSASCQIQQQQVTPTIGTSGVTSGQAITSNIDGDFNGWDGETLYKLLNGQYWQQSSYYYYYYYAYSPKVLVYASNGAYYMHVDGVSGQDVSVVPITNVLESQIDGDFNGWQGNTAYTLVNGQVWQQTDYHYHYHYAYSPKVIIYQSNSGGTKMHVEGDSDQDISVSRIN